MLLDAFVLILIGFTGVIPHIIHLRNLYDVLKAE